MYCIFFFKQKTAYEMRISDWSSDVCSSDLLRQEMEETFREFHAQSGATMIYVTHDQSEAMALATDVAVMSEGKLLQMAPPLEIYARPEGRIVGGLVGPGAILRLAVVDDARHQDWQRLRAPLYAGTGGPAAGDVPVRPPS